MELIRKASYPDVEQLSQVLARSFAKEEFWTWVVNARQISEQEKQQRLERVFKIQLTQFALPYHHVYCDENTLGAALWSPPNQWHLNLIT